MSKNCKGLFGNWFGHRFETYLIQGGVQLKTHGAHSSIYVQKDLDSFIDKYEIRCKRCGCKTEDE